MRIEINVKKGSIDVSKMMRKIQENTVNLTVNEFERLVKEKTPVDTGDLRSSWHHHINKLEGNVYTSKDYAEYVEEGTGVYGPKEEPIRPVRANVLAFQPHKSGDFADIIAQDGYVYLTESKGQKPAHMVKDSIEEIGDHLPKLVMQAIDKAGAD